MLNLDKQVTYGRNSEPKMRIFATCKCYHKSRLLSYDTSNDKSNSLVPLLSQLFLTEEADTNQHEIDSIDDKLKQLTERKAELQKSLDNLVNVKHENKGKKGESKLTAENLYSITLSFCNHPFLLLLAVSLTPDQKVEPGVPVPGSNIFYVEAPPTIPGESVMHSGRGSIYFYKFT